MQTNHCPTIMPLYCCFIYEFELHITVAALGLQYVSINLFIIIITIGRGRVVDGKVVFTEVCLLQILQQI